MMNSASKPYTNIRETDNQAIIPGLPDDLALRCLAKLSHGYHGLLQAVSKGWRDLIRCPAYSNYKAREGWCGNWLFVLSEESRNQWVAYDPEADRWHSLPVIPAKISNCRHYGFSCVTVSNKFLVLGGSYSPHGSVRHNEIPTVTNDVLLFDPFTKQWRRAASMRTPRSDFACAVVNDKVYVAGGHKWQCSRALDVAEVYDPVTDKWEDLPPMRSPQMDCLGLSCKGKFYVLRHQGGPHGRITSDVYNPLDGTWSTTNDVWPFSWVMRFLVQMQEDEVIYTVVNWRESCIRSRDNIQGEWKHVGSVPLTYLPDHPGPVKTFGCGFAALKKQLYIMCGKVIALNEAGAAGGLDIVKLGVVRVCDPSVKPLIWRETKPMCASACGCILGCATLEEKASP